MLLGYNRLLGTPACGFDNKCEPNEASMYYGNELEGVLRIKANKI